VNDLGLHGSKGGGLRHGKIGFVTVSRRAALCVMTEAAEHREKVAVAESRFFIH